MLSFGKQLLQKQSMLKRPMTSFTRPYLAATSLTNYQLRLATGRTQSGLQGYEFDYNFESKIDHGKFPNKLHSYMKVLGKDYDVKSE